MKAAQHNDEEEGGANFGERSRGYCQSSRKRACAGDGGSRLTPEDVGGGCPGDEDEP